MSARPDAAVQGARSTMPDMRPALFLAPALLAAACSTQTLYDTGQAWQRQECQKLQDRDERVRCEKSTARSFEDYQAEVARTSKKSKP